LINDKNILLEQFLTSLMDLHTNFTKECVNELGKFDGQAFMGPYVSTIDKKYEILRGDILPVQKIQINFNSLKDLNLKYEVACIKIKSISNVQDLIGILNWYINGPASMLWRKLFIYEGDSGEPLGNVRHIDNILSEDINFFALYADQVNSLTGQKVEHERRLLAFKQENLNLSSQVQDLLHQNQSLSKVLSQSQTQLKVDQSRPPTPTISSVQFSVLSEAIENVIKPRVVSLFDDFQKIKPQIKQIQSDIVVVNKEKSSYFITEIFLFLFLLGAAGTSYVFYLELDEMKKALRSSMSEISRMEERLKKEINIVRSPVGGEQEKGKTGTKVKSDEHNLNQ